MDVRLDPSWLLGSESNFLAIPRCEFNRGWHFLRYVRVEIFDRHLVAPVGRTREKPVGSPTLVAYTLPNVLVNSAQFHFPQVLDNLFASNQ